MNPVVHFEMPYENSERLVKFYAQAFGWQMNKLGKEMGDYVTAATTETDKNGMVKRPGAINGGFFPKKPDARSISFYGYRRGRYQGSNEEDRRCGWKGSW